MKDNNKACLCPVCRAPIDETKITLVGGATKMLDV